MIVKTFKKYGLLSLVADALRTGLLMDITCMKRLVKGTVYAADQRRFECSCMMYKSLGNYTNSIQQVAMWFWWKYTKIRPEQTFKCKTIMRMVTGETCFNSNVYRFGSSRGSTICQLCDKYVSESVHHVICECTFHQDTRERYWSVVEQVSPINLANAMKSGDTIQLMFSGFNQSKITTEWIEMYDAVIEFLYNMYECRRAVHLT